MAWVEPGNRWKTDGYANVNVDLRLHPIQFVKHLKRRYGDDLVLRFSRYTHIPKVRTDRRQSFQICAQDVTARWLRHALTRLTPSEELALESRVKHRGRNRHIGMLDFRGMTRGQLTAVMDVLPPTYAEGIQVYFSGRSFHAYFPYLLTTRQWMKFMGSALLCNERGSEVVDQRWVGHRLIGGYATLRWSCSSARHQELPIRVPIRALDLPFSGKLKVIAEVACV